MAESEPGDGDGWSGDMLSILWPSLSGLVKEQQGRGGQQGSGSASACSGSRLPPLSPPALPFIPVCVWQLNSEAGGSGWRTARTPGSRGCWLFLRLAAGRARLQT